MPIHFGPGEPENGRALVATEIVRVLDPKVQGPGVMTVSRPHRSFSCDLAGAADDVVAHARLRAWRYLVFRDEVCVAAAKVVQGPDGVPLLSSISYGGDFTTQMAELDWLSGQAESQPADYELRFLRVRGGAHVSAWWLGFEQGPGAGDLFIPVPPSPASLRPHEHTLYDPEHFRDAVRVVAKARQAAAEVLFASLPQEQSPP